MRLVGQTSGAERSIIVDSRLITDEKGSLLGSFHIPDVTENPTALLSELDL